MVELMPKTPRNTWEKDWRSTLCTLCKHLPSKQWEDLKVHEDPNLVGVAMNAHNIVPSKTTALVHPAESDVCRAVIMSLE